MAFLTSRDSTPGRLFESDDEDARMLVAVGRRRPALFAVAMTVVFVVALVVWPLLALWELVTLDWAHWFHRLTSHPLRECTDEEIEQDS